MNDRDRYFAADDAFWAATTNDAPGLPAKEVAMKNDSMMAVLALTVAALAMGSVLWPVISQALTLATSV